MMSRGVLALKASIFMLRSPCRLLPFGNRYPPIDPWTLSNWLPSFSGCDFAATH
jgi:hypothetical protein